MRRFTVFHLGFIIYLFLLVAPSVCYANNISVANVSITSQSTSAQTCKVQFDISWDNSWRNSVNYDAAWVFIKYSTDGGTTWNHATLKTSGTNPSGFSQGSGTGLDIVVPTDKKGAFLQRTANGAGSISTTAVQFVWDWGTDGLSSSTTARVEVFAVEMVYIPTGSFYIGDGNGTTESTGALYQTANTTVQINTTLQSNIKCASTSYDDSQLTSSGIGIKGNGGLDTNNDGTIENANFPTGYNAFYIMKYDVSQQQWVDFFNTLTSTQKTTRDITSSSGKNSQGTVSRNTISWAGGSSSALAGANQYVGCNYLSWMDVAAYAAWAALRPMTELEFEKAARGPNTPTATEYAWGTTDLTQVTSITNSGASNETAGQTGNGLCSYGNVIGGPLRCGFAATSNTTRLSAGSSYWGVMELSGNLWKRPVTIGNSTGRAFTGSNGTGVLSTNGNATNADWPGYASGEVTGATGSGFRGGGWGAGSTYARSSARYLAALTDTTRSTDHGARCVRTSP